VGGGVGRTKTQHRNTTTHLHGATDALIASVQSNSAKGRIDAFCTAPILYDAFLKLPLPVRTVESIEYTAMSPLPGGR